MISSTLRKEASIRLSAGTDLTELERIARLIAVYGDRFLSRVYTDRERSLAASRRDPVPYYAGRFAAKEAILKCLGTGLTGGIRWRDVEILREPSGKPVVVLHGRAEEAARRTRLGPIEISISHGRELALAFAVAALTGD